MAKYILTIGKDYISSWTIEDAIRELIQNKIDQEISDPNNIGSIEIKDDKLLISNKTSKLTKSSLVLGCSSKQNDSESIGKFGEGYKLALLVLIRNGIEVIIHNYFTKENWIPSIEYVKEYDSELLVINTDKYWFTSPPDSNLTFVISGLSNIQNILDKILINELSYKEIYETPYGNILVGDKKGDIFVNGLYVTNIESLDYSYSIKPKYLNIGRDRNLVSDFDIKYILADMWKHAPEAIALNVIRNESKDVDLLQYKSYGVQEFVTKELLNDVGNHIPVTNQQEVEEAKKMYGDKVLTKIVSNTIKSIIKDKLPKQTLIRCKSTSELLEEFYNKHKRQFTRDMKKDWDKLRKI